MSPITPSRRIETQLTRHQAACRACRRCADDGLIEEANPCLQGTARAVFMLVGQAPGPVEHASGLPFQGRSGRELERWMLRAGFASAAEFRELTYIAAVARCFPGRNPAGTGDRVPPRRMLANCASWLEAELELLRPRAILAVGGLAIARFAGPMPLGEAVGRSFGDDPVVVPLPHPSGQSRWLNDPAHRHLLEAALDLVFAVRERWTTARS